MSRRLGAVDGASLGFGRRSRWPSSSSPKFPRGLIALACVALAFAAAWYGVLRRGGPRVAGLSLGAVGLGAAIALLVGDGLLEEVLVVGRCC